MAALDEESDYRWLAAACLHGEVEAVKYIVSVATEALGDSRRAITAFMMACSLGHCEIVKHLLTSGMDANVVDMTIFKGMTGLHECVSTGKLECVKQLMRHGARLDIKNDKGLTPLLQASAEGRANIVRYFIRLPICTVTAKIEALELLGAMFVDDKRDLDSAVYYWSKSLKQRGKAHDDVSPKSKETHPAFGAVEFNTDEELDEMESSVDEMQMQSLLIRERIFGPQHSHTSTYVIRRATAYAAEADFETSIELLTYILDVQQKSDGVCNWTLEEFGSLINMFSKVMFEGSPVEYRHLVAVLTKMVNMVEHEMKPQMDPEQPWNVTAGSNDDLVCVLRSVSILAQLQPTVSADDRLEFRRVIEKIVQLNVRDRNGYTPLHMAGWQAESLRSPLDLVQLLLEAGADARAVSLSGETTLHMAAYSEHHDQPHIIRLLLSNGAHYDACNTEGNSFTDLLDGENDFQVENPMEYCSLQCLAAKAVKRHGIAFESKVPSHVSEFIKMH